VSVATATPEVDGQRQVGEQEHRMWWTLAITSIALFMVTLDNLVVTNALPTIQRDFNTTIQGLEWTVNAYTLTFAVLLLTGAALGDRYGRRLMFVIGLVIFTAASAGAALSTNIETLDATRALQGLGGAIVTPLTLTILSDAFPRERRGMALGIWSGISGIAVALGPVTGGAIVTGIAWEWIFWINVPIGIIAIPLALLRLRETRGPDRHLDFPGLLLSGAGLFGLVWGLIRGSEIGWTTREVIASLALGTILTAAFVLWELRTRTPMLRMQYFRSRQFAATNAASFFMYFGLFGSLFLIIQFFQVVQGYSALKAGLATLPSTGLPVFIAPLAGMLLDKIGGRPLIVAGLVLQTIGLGWIAAVTTPTMPYLDVLPPMIIFGVGMGLFFPPVAYLVLGAVPQEAAGQASGANNAIREIGGVFGIGALTTIFATYGSYRSGVAYTDGLVPAVWVGTGIVALGAIASVFVPGLRRGRVPEVVPTVVDVPDRAPLLSANGPDAAAAFQHQHAEASLRHEHGAETDAFPCPVCMGHGWFPFEPPQDPRTATCPRCYGHGKVLTGSHVVGNTVRDCPDCQALGYVEVRQAYEPAPIPEAAPTGAWPGTKWEPEEDG
jgi:EmrB/QacA subfamily drug resistance transporter